jgi:hypothetical protein
MVKAGLVKIFQGAYPKLSTNFKETVSPAHGNF